MKEHRENFRKLNAKIILALGKGKKFTRAELRKEVGSTPQGLSKITLQNHLTSLIKEKYIVIFKDSDGKYRIQAKVFYDEKKMQSLNRNHLFGRLITEIFNTWVLDGKVAPDSLDFWENNVLLFIPQKVDGILKTTYVKFCPLKIYEKLLKPVIDE